MIRKALEWPLALGIGIAAIILTALCCVIYTGLVLYWMVKALVTDVFEQEVLSESSDECTNENAP